MIDPIKIFGKTPRSTNEFVVWLKKGISRSEFLSLIERDDRLSDNEQRFTLVSLVERHNSQPLKESDFVRPPLPNRTDYSFDQESFDRDLENHNNWTPKFKGKIEVNEGTPDLIFFKRMTLWFAPIGMMLRMEEIADYSFIIQDYNEFFTHCESQGIELEFYEGKL